MDDIQLVKDKKQAYYFSRQFENRLFDRDTFLLAHYDVNFLFVLALYGRNNRSSQVHWRNKVKEMFRKETQEMLKKHYEFYAITAHADVDPEQYIKENFQYTLGKVYHAFENREEQQYYSLALRNPEAFTDDDTEHGKQLREVIRDENESIKFRLLQSFYMKECPLGTDPRTLSNDENWPIVTPIQHCDIQPSLLTFHHLENYPNTSFLIGGFDKERQLGWMFGRQNGKRDDAYNVRIGRVPGGVVKSRDYIKHAKFVILYEFDDSQPEHVFKVFRVKNIGEMTKEQLKTQGYIDPHFDKYLCYFFDEEVSIGNIDVASIINDARCKGGSYEKGMPIYMTGKELLQYRK